MDRKEIRAQREAYHQKLRAKHLLEGFSYDDGTEFVTRPYWPLEPKNSVQPHLWRWDEVLPLVQECGEMVGLGRGDSKYDRRVLALSNPGTGADFSMTGPLFGDLQLIRPGESAPCHRHTPSATRFILQGNGGWTSVAGEKVHVRPGDIVHTGQNPWHDHGNDGSDDFIFLDMLDIPLLYFTGTSAWEFDYQPLTGSVDQVNQPVSATDFPNQLYTQSHLRPTFKTKWERNPRDFAHLSWDNLRSTLQAMGEEQGSDYDDIRCEFRNTSGGPVGATVSVHAQWIRPGRETLSHRHTGASAFVCAEGSGSVQIEGKEFEFGPKDIFVIPSWHWHSFKSREGTVLQSISDFALVRKMNLYREQRRLQEGSVLDSGWTDQAEPFEL